MKKYKLLEECTFDFLTPQDQYTSFFEPGTIIKANEHTIWVVENGKEIETINTIAHLAIFLKQNRIVEITD